VEWVVREGGWGQWGKMTQAFYTHMNNKNKNKKINFFRTGGGDTQWLWTVLPLSGNQLCRLLAV
jgi:hypothetical protein